MNDDLIRREDVLRLLRDPRRLVPLVAKDIQEIPSASPEEKLYPEERLKLFTRKFPDGRTEYRYGTEQAAIQLIQEGGYDTPEKAMSAWGITYNRI